MGNTISSEDSAVSDEGIVTVGTGSGSSFKPQDELLRKLQQLPQVQQATQGKGVYDQMWRDLALYSREQLQLDPSLTLRLLNTYKAWCESQAGTVAQQQDFVNIRISDIDKVASEVLVQCQRRQQTLEATANIHRSLATTQQQMEDLSVRLTACAKVLGKAQQHFDTQSDPGCSHV